MSDAAVAPDLVRITLPDGSIREVAAGTTVRQVAESIGARLARAALGGKADGRVVDLDRPLERDTTLEILTDRSADALEVLRHSAAHVLATAVRRLRPEARIGFGPAIEDGFYYDFEVATPFTAEELERIEKEMAAVASEDFPFERRVVDKPEARRLFADDPLKLERLEELGDDETISTYRDGPFVDLCRGPHLPSTGRLKHFKLLHTAGAYWRGDEKRQMLQRIYGTAWFSKEELDAYLHRLEEAKRRDHRRLGKELELFAITPRIGQGLILWLPKGTVIRESLETFLRDAQRERGYQGVVTPHIGNLDLYRTSGHYPYYAESQFTPLKLEENEEYLLKPMNCPHHCMIYAARPRSYRDLPLRLAEFGTVYRYEQSGELNGLTRVRSFTVDDAHLFVRPDQVQEELGRVVDLIQTVMSTLGFADFTTRLSFRDPDDPGKYVGADELWVGAEAAIRSVADAKELRYTIGIGEAAFYGPKIDFMVRDVIGRQWQLGTVQLDYNLPERFELEYTGDDNRPHRPVMIHRAPFGSLERFVGVLIEHFGGAFPVWLAPVQVVVIPISDEQAVSARELVAQMQAAGLRAELDDRNETLNYRIREAETQKVPYMAVVGGREAEQETVAVRARGAGKKQTILPRDQFVARLAEQARSRRLEVGVE